MKDPRNTSDSLLVRGICLLISGVGIGWLIGLSVSPIIHIIITSLIALVVSVTGALAGIKVDEKEDSADDGKSKRKVQVEVNPLPLMFMIIGLVIGSSLGVYARTNGWLGPDPNGFVEKWKDTELTKQEISRRLFDDLYPVRAGSTNPVNAGGSSIANVQSNEPAIGPGASTENIHGSTVTASGNAGVTGANPSPRKESGTSTGKSEASASSDSALAKSKVSALFNVDADDCADFRVARDEELRGVMNSGVGSNEKARRMIEQCPDIKCLRDIVKQICAK
jgi:hypothetical protein